MRVRVKKWGNRLALRIPTAVARSAKLGEGSELELALVRGRLVMSSLHPAYKLDELVRRITPRNRHHETDWDSPLGRESW
ncbi:MAG: AbrB/MazE/SpoVT family DNA-binding domain-containing protein [Alphaproteobacteria bacterium]